METNLEDTLKSIPKVVNEKSVVTTELIDWLSGLHDKMIDYHNAPSHIDFIKLVVTMNQMIEEMDQLRTRLDKSIEMYVRRDLINAAIRETFPRLNFRHY